MFINLRCGTARYLTSNIQHLFMKKRHFLFIFYYINPNWMRMKADYMDYMDFSHFRQEEMGEKAHT